MTIEQLSARPLKFRMSPHFTASLCSKKRDRILLHFVAPQSLLSLSIDHIFAENWHNIGKKMLVFFLSFHSNSRDEKKTFLWRYKVLCIYIFVLCCAHVVFIILLHSDKNTTAMKLDTWAKSGKIVKTRECSWKQEEMIRPRLFAAQFAEVRGKRLPLRLQVSYDRAIITIRRIA